MRDVAITGVGVVSPLGHSLAELTRRVAAGEVAAGDAAGVQVADIPLAVLPAAARVRSGRLDRVCRLALAAAYLAVDDARLSLPLVRPERVGLSLGTGLGCLLSDAEFYEKVVVQGAAAASPRVFAYTVSSAAAGEISIALGIRGPNATAHMGWTTAGIGALGYAADLIRLGKADIVLAGGVDANGAALSEALRDMGLIKQRPAARPFLDSIPGVRPSEGAMVAVLEGAETAAARGARTYARLAGHAAGFEPSLTRPLRDPAGVAAVLRRAVEVAGVGRPAVVFASPHGTPLDAVERDALRAALGDQAVPVIAPKAALGETFGAGGALATALAIGLRVGPTVLAPGVALDLAGHAWPSAALGSGPALVSAVCYTGSVAALVVEEKGLRG